MRKMIRGLESHILCLLILATAHAETFTNQTCDKMKGEVVLESKSIKIVDNKPCTVMIEQTISNKSLKYMKYRSPLYSECEKVAIEEVMKLYKKGFVCGNI